MLQKIMIQGYTTSNRTDTSRRTGENGAQSCKNNDKHPYDQRIPNTASHPPLPKSKRTDRKAGGTEDYGITLLSA